MRKWILLFTVVLTSCYSEIIDYQKVKNIDIFSNVLIEIKNEAVDVTLEVNDYYIEGVDYTEYTDYFNPFILKYGESDSLIRFKTVPQDFKDVKIWLNGKLDTNNYTIYDGFICIPLSKTLKPGDNQILLELYDNCPWYCIYNGNYIKLLKSITFLPSVEDWKN